MRKLILFISLVCSLKLFPQASYNPPKYVYQGQEYFVYPVRTGNTKGVPPTAFKMPDGKYIIFDEYNFKRDRKKKKMVLLDTTQVTGIFTVKNSIANGPAEFYRYPRKYKKGAYHSAKEWNYKVSGVYEDGLKSGTWITQNKKWIEKRENFKNGILDGEVLEYYLNGALESGTKYRDGRMCDTVFKWNVNGTLSHCYDIKRVNDTITPPDNFSDYIYDKHIKSGLSFYLHPRSFYKEYDEAGRLKNSIRYTYGKNPEFDSIISDGEKWYVKKLNNTTNPDEQQHLIVRKVTEEKFSETTTEYYYTGQKLTREKSIEYYFKSKEKYESEQVFVDLTKLDFRSWKDTVISINNYGKAGTVKHHLIPAIGYYWKEGSYDGLDYRPLQVDTVKRKIFSRDTLGKKSDIIGVAREISIYEKDRKDMKWERAEAEEQFKFLSGVSDVRTWYYFTSSVNLPRAYDFKQYASDFNGSAWGLTWLENKKPMNGVHVFLDDAKVLRKNKFSAPKHHFTETRGTAEMGFLLNGVRSGRWEQLLVKRKKHITDNFEKSFRYKPRAGEYYIAGDFKDGEKEGFVRAWTTESKSIMENGRYVLRLFTYMEYEANYSENYLHGPYKTFHYNGKLKYSANMWNGRIDGVYEFFDEEGKLTKYASFKKDTLHGDYAEFVDGKKNVEAHFENNMLQGEYIVYSTQNAKPILKISADKNRMLSKQLFFDNGALKEEVVFTDSSKAVFGKKMASFSSFIEDRREIKMGEQEMSALCTSYFENGKILSQGKFVNGKPAGTWKFYNIAGTLVNQVDFSDSLMLLAGDKDSTRIKGRVTGYFNNGKKRVTGFVTWWTSGYDCSTHQDKTKFTVIVKDAWTFEGKQVIANGNGAGTQYDENGNRISDGQLVNYKPHGIWKYFDPNQKLNETGKYENGLKQGLWFSGDLENLNFEDAACFNADDKEAQKKFEYSKNQLKFYTELYKDGKMISSQRYDTNLNKEREYEEYDYYRRSKRRLHNYGDF
jgi:antitoxin component YwqK of YwqJK toxin-antitoxin module